VALNLYAHKQFHSIQNLGKSSGKNSIAAANYKLHEFKKSITMEQELTMSKGNIRPLPQNNGPHDFRSVAQKGQPQTPITGQSCFY
jgi:hypothetical protein